MDETKQARFTAMADQVRAHFEDGFRILAQLFEERAHEAFGLTWPEYFAQEFGEVMTKIRDVSVRRDVVRKLTDAGMSQREVAQATGVDQKTVSNDLRPEENSSKRNPAPEPSTTMVRAGISKNLDQGLDKLAAMSKTSPETKQEVIHDLERLQIRITSLLGRIKEDESQTV